MIKLSLFLILLFPMSSPANAIIPLHFILRPSVGYLVAFIAIVLIESLIFKIFRRENTYVQHLKYISIANAASSLAGTLVIYLINNNEFSLNQMYWKFFYIFLITTLMVETPIYRVLYKERNYQELIKTTLTAHLFSYGVLLLYPLLILQISIYNSQIEAAEKRTLWANKEILNNDLRIIYSKTIEHGQKTKVVEVTKSSHKELENFKGKYIFDISGDFLISRENSYDKKVRIINWKKNLPLLSMEDRYSTRIFASTNYGLLIFTQNANLEGIIDSNGWRNMYGTSYKIKSLSDKYRFLSEIKDVRFGGIYNFENDLIYSKHSKCIFDISESKSSYRVERCENNPSSSIVRKHGENHLILASDSSNQILINSKLFYLSENKIFQLDLRQNKRMQIINEDIENFKISEDMQFLLAETVSHTVFGNSSFLVLIDLKNDKRLIIDEGQILAYDFIK